MNNKLITEMEENNEKDEKTADNESAVSMNGTNPKSKTANSKQKKQAARPKKPKRKKAAKKPPKATTKRRNRSAQCRRAKESSLKNMKKTKTAKATRRNVKIPTTTNISLRAQRPKELVAGRYEAKFLRLDKGYSHEHLTWELGVELEAYRIVLRQITDQHPAPGTACGRTLSNLLEKPIREVDLADVHLAIGKKCLVDVDFQNGLPYVKRVLPWHAGLAEDETEGIAKIPAGPHIALFADLRMMSAAPDKSLRWDFIVPHEGSRVRLTRYSGLEPTPGSDGLRMMLNLTGKSAANLKPADIESALGNRCLLLVKEKEGEPYVESAYSLRNVSFDLATSKVKKFRLGVYLAKFAGVDERQLWSGSDQLSWNFDILKRSKEYRIQRTTGRDLVAGTEGGVLASNLLNKSVDEIELADVIGAAGCMCLIIVTARNGQPWVESVFGLDTLWQEAAAWEEVLH